MKDLIPPLVFAAIFIIAHVIAVHVFQWGQI